jgi:glycosyltransferase involved in cell wall biosynthesis
MRGAAAQAGAVYLNVSHFGLEQPQALARLAARGVRPAVFVHDLIPIRRPEFCAPGAAARHERRIEATLAHARLIIVNSQATARDLADYAVERGLPAPRPCVAPLGLESAFLERPEPLASPVPYFVVVGTIEPRKNLAFLLTLWREIAGRLGEGTPRLVLVGRRGWEYEAVLDHLDRSPPVRRLVHEVGDLKDKEIARLLAGAVALLAPSLTEGFDLASLEAMAVGAPVIASRIAAHEELVAGAQLIDPLDGPGWIGAIEAALAARISPSPFRAPTWAEHFAIVEEALARLAPDQV